MIKKKSLLRNLFLAIMVVCQLFTLIRPMPVSAALTLRDAESQEDYYGYELSWMVYSDFNWDILESISSTEGIVAEYQYNSYGIRTQKIIDEKTTQYTYSEDGRLLSVSDGINVIYYEYEYNKDLSEYILLGFECLGLKYKFGFNNGLIDTITYNDNEVAKYIYDDYGTFIMTQSLNDSGDWVENADEEFIGNINKLRFNESCYDDETGWYYKKRYYDPAHGRYVDGISYGEAMQMIANNSDNIGNVLARVYSMGCYQSSSHANQKRMLRGVSESEQKDVITRVLNAEAGSKKNDWYAVGWVVYNRMVDSRFEGSTAYAIVTAEEQFSSYWENSDEYASPDTTTERWAECLIITSSLYNGNAPALSVANISNQVFFRSINTFINGYDSPDGIPRFGGRFIKDVVIPDVGNVGNGLSEYDFCMTYAGYSGMYNVYFNYMY